MKSLNPVTISGREVLPLVEGGKGVAISNWESSGAWAACGGVGTVSCVNADAYDDEDGIIRQVYHAKTRKLRHQELIDYGIAGGLAQVRRAHDLSGGEGRIHMNVLWEMGGAEAVMRGVLDQARGLVHGVTCGAGMPYRLAGLAAEYGIYCYPIISSARAFSALWKRAYHKFPESLGGVVYEDPWLAGGHNGLTNKEDPKTPETPMPRVIELRQVMRGFGLGSVPIVMAGGVWCLREWEDWIDNPDLGPIVFQFGTRPLLTKESPISDAWKRKLLTLAQGDVLLHRFSPTGFYSSALYNSFLKELEGRTERQISHAADAADDPALVSFDIGPRKRPVYVTPQDREKGLAWQAQGFDQVLRTPDSSLIFVSAEKAGEIHQDQTDCMGCLSSCLFSNWSEGESGSTGRKTDPRSFCIQKTLQDVAHDGSTENNLVFGGHNACRFGSDPFYSNGFVPTVKELFDRLVTGD